MNKIKNGIDLLSSKNHDSSTSTNSSPRNATRSQRSLSVQRNLLSQKEKIYSKKYKENDFSTLPKEDVEFVKVLENKKESTKLVHSSVKDCPSMIVHPLDETSDENSHLFVNIITQDPYLSSNP